jgi:hypothetical protein
MALRKILILSARASAQSKDAQRQSSVAANFFSRSEPVQGRTRDFAARSAGAAGR